LSGFLDSKNLMPLHERKEIQALTEDIAGTKTPLKG
jgi:hypothetical protein